MAADAVLDAVVVGGGLSGLVAANVLREKGLKVVLVEAAGGLGGRVKTHPGLSTEYPVELGAEFIHGPTNALMDLVKKYNLETEYIFTWAQGDGGPSDAPVRGCIAYYWFPKQKRMLRFDSDDKDLKRLHDALWNIENIDPSKWNANHTVEDYLKSLGISGSFLEMANGGYANTLCNSLWELPLLSAATLFKHFAADGDGEYRILPSWQSLLEKLAAPLEIRLNWEAKAINWPSGAQQSGRCEVINEKGQKIIADRVIVATPLPILRDGDIRFQPSLPREKTEALRRIKFGPCFKVALRFNRRFWPQDMHGVICADSEVPEWWALPTHDPPQGVQFKEFVLTGFTCCHYSLRLSALTRDALLQVLLKQLDAMFATNVDPTPATNSFEDLVIKNWTTDRFIRGGYSSPQLGGLPEDRSTVAAPLSDRVFFAGEHTHPTRFMVAHAAVEMGERAALQCVEAVRNAKAKGSRQTPSVRSKL